MKTLYLECNMGAAGDMLTAALSELIPDKEGFLKELNNLGIPGVVFERDYKLSSGIQGAHMKVLVNNQEEMSLDVHEHQHDDDHHHHNHEDEHHGHHHHDHEDEHHGHHHHDHEDGHHEHHHEHQHAGGHHHHTSMADVESIVSKLPVSDKVKTDVLGIYKMIAEAESAAHGKPVSEVHFHEVGAMDAIADVTAVCMLFEKLGPKKVVCSPIHVGSGNVRCAHGILPVPVPATAHILQGVPIYGGRIKGELCTPTGAAILKYFSDEFGDMPPMKCEKIGIGAGNKEFEAANIVRAFIGESEAEKDEIIELSCNLDDSTGEELGYVLSLLMKEGALDAFLVPIQMKKSRPGYMLVVMAREKDADYLGELMLRHTTTLGVRKKNCQRMVMDRNIENVETKYGNVRVKVSTYKDIRKTKPEYDDIEVIAQKTGKSYREIVKELNL